MFRVPSFDPEGLAGLDAALDNAWRAVSHWPSVSANRTRAQIIRECLARAIVVAALKGERSQAALTTIAVNALSRPRPAPGARSKRLRPRRPVSSTTA